MELDSALYVEGYLDSALYVEGYLDSALYVEGCGIILLRLINHKYMNGD